MTEQKSASSKCWEKESVFQSVKVILEVSLAPLSGPPVIDISFAQATFRNSFGYSSETLPMTLQELISEANDMNDVVNLIQTVLEGARIDTFITLKDARGIDLACYVQVLSARKADKRVSQSSDGTAGMVRSHFTTMTIRSASTVGNVRAINLLVDPALVGSARACCDAEAYERMLGLVTQRIDHNTRTAEALATTKRVTSAADR